MTHNSDPANLPADATATAGPADLSVVPYRAITIVDLPDPARRVIALALGHSRTLLSADEVRCILTTDLCALHTVGPTRARATVDAVIHQMVAGRLIADPGTAAPEPTITDDDIVRAIRDDNLTVTEATERFERTDSELRALIADHNSAAASSIARRWAALDLAQQGFGLREIGARIGISGERVRQLLARHNITTKELRDSLRALDHVRTARTREEIEGFVRAFPGVSAKEIQHMFNLGASDLAEALGNVDHLVLDPADAADADRLAARRQQVIDSLRAAAAKESPLSSARYEDMVRAGDVPGPGRQTAMVLFSTWNAACDAAGVDHNEPVRAAYTRRWSDDEIRAWVMRYLIDENYHGTAEGYTAWVDGRDGPSLAHARNQHAGSWSDTRRHALIALRSEWAQGADRTEFSSWTITRRCRG